MIVFPPPIRFSNLFQLGIATLTVQRSGRNNYKILHDDFFTVHTHNNHKNPENTEYPHTYPVTLLCHHH